MWQDFKDFITIDSLHIVCFWSLIILAVTGLIEIIYQIRSAIKKINIVDEYAKHIEVIQKHVKNRLDKSRQYGISDTTDLNEIVESINFVELNYDEARSSIDGYDYVSDPIFSLYIMLYYREWDDRKVAIRCHQIIIEFYRGKKKIKKEIKQNFIFLFVPFTKLYRGFCVLFRLLVFPVKRCFRNFDKSGKWESSVAAAAEVFALVNAVVEFVKHVS
ncbi:MAG: hypothetical protein SOY65_09935 [Marinifilaceae bacterium]|nr:hypothetical protein [Marinifilaceae bacterium]